MVDIQPERAKQFLCVILYPSKQVWFGNMRVSSFHILLLAILVFPLFSCGKSGPLQGIEPTDVSAEQARATIRAFDTDRDGKVSLEGLVIENVKGCEVDVSCMLMVHTDSTKVNVIYHYGEWPPCQNSKATEQGFAIVEGDQVVVYGALTQGGELSTCDATEFYIKKVGSD